MSTLFWLSWVLRNISHNNINLRRLQRFSVDFSRTPHRMQLISDHISCWDTVILQIQMHRISIKVCSHLQRWQSLHLPATACGRYAANRSTSRENRSQPSAGFSSWPPANRSAMSWYWSHCWRLGHAERILDASNYICLLSRQPELRHTICCCNTDITMQRCARWILTWPCSSFYF